MSMKQICSQKLYKAECLNWPAIRTKVSRAAFIAGIALIFVTFCMADVPFATMAATGVTGALLTLASCRWTGWIDQYDYDMEDDDNE